MAIHRTLGMKFCLKIKDAEVSSEKTSDLPNLQA